MLICFDSRTGNVKKFIERTKIKAKQITEAMEVDEPFILVTYTTGFGSTPEITEKFLQKNNGFLKGVISSGNRNWGDAFGKAADTISQKYKVPLLMKFELMGTKTDIENFKEIVEGEAV